MRSSPLPRRDGGAFTLVEMLVSLAILSLLLVMLASITDATRRTWTYTSGKVEEFRDAREAFESITRKLSQATLNTYWDYEYPKNSAGNPDTTQAPTRYVRQSELRFISGNAAALTGSSGTLPTHAVFFQAPLGYVNDTKSFADLQNLLNTWGYFVEFGTDKGSRPPFLETLAPVPQERWRFRLMELMEPAESLTLYNEEVAAGGNAKYDKKTWFTLPLGASPRPVRVLAENIVALIILPRLSQGEKDSGGIAYAASRLAPEYTYDSTVSNADAALNSKNQLPPVVQVTLVAVDEASYNRMQNQQGTSGAWLDFSTLFTKAADYDGDMDKLRSALQAKRLNYCVFTTNVSLKAAKWSRAQTR